MFKSYKKNIKNYNLFVYIKRANWLVPVTNWIKQQIVYDVIDRKCMFINTSESFPIPIGEERFTLWCLNG